MYLLPPIIINPKLRLIVKKLNNWRKISNISAYTCGVVVIIHTFFREYLLKYIPILVAIEAATIALFLFAELMKLIIRKRKNK